MNEITVHIRDGRTALVFQDAKDFRTLLHSKPGLKNGGETVKAVEWRWTPEREKYIPTIDVELRYVDRHSVSRVQQGLPEVKT